jgi:hypothetical protein
MIFYDFDAKRVISEYVHIRVDTLKSARGISPPISQG